MKAQVTWKGEEDSDTKEVVWAGQTFEKGKAVELTDEKMIEKAQGNQFFSVKVTDKATTREVPYEQAVQPAPSNMASPQHPASKPGEPVRDLPPSGQTAKVVPPPPMVAPMPSTQTSKK